MAGVNGWYLAIGWNQPGIASIGVNAVEMRDRRISGIALLLDGGRVGGRGGGRPRPPPTAIQASARAKSVSNR